jgi:hypothetical protein
VTLGLPGYQQTAGIPGYQYASDEDALPARLAAIEQALALPPRRPAVGDWALDMDVNGNLVAINLRTSTVYPVSLGSGTPLPTS